MPSREHPFAGDHVSVAGRLTMFSRRDVRRLVERLGGSFSADISPRTTVVVRGPESEMPGFSQGRVLTESDLCTIAGLPDLETLRSHYYAVKDLRVRYPALRDDHLRYLEKWGLIQAVAGRYSFADLTLLKHAAARDRKRRDAAGAAAHAGRTAPGPARL